ncbi:MAG: tetraacyldisaccharide 4'-kinase [Planctomycetes bacterium]|nr:tetraacyldisaccharide 4'-kinase [Planctomycetota bacterium]
MVAARNMTFDRGWRRALRLPVPVVSVGNLTVGGTGKTPFVVLLIESFQKAGLRVGVLARGYGKRPGQELNDEGELLARRFPGLPQVQEPSRFAGGQKLLSDHRVDIVLLDDGFQHRMLHRDVDVCLVDAKEPLDRALLPAGWAREPASSLARADVCVLTGAERVSDSELRARVDAVRSRFDGMPCHAVRTTVRDLVEYPGGTVHAPTSLEGRSVVLVAAIARPERFESSALALGCDVVDRHWLRDHQEIDASFLADKSREAHARGAWLLLTEKDEARLRMAPDAGPTRHVLRIRSEFVGDPGIEAFLPAALASTVS